MKKTSYFVLLILAMCGIILTSCEPEEEVLNCDYEGIQVKEVKFGKDSSIVIYPVMTINNYEFCDSMVWDETANDYVRPSEYDEDKVCSQDSAYAAMRRGADSLCPCRENPYEEHNDKINSVFYIEGIKKFPYNKLRILVPGDTIKIRNYENYDNVSNVFQGFVPTNLELEYYQYYNSKILASGVYDYELILYKDEELTVPFEDTISDSFVVITYRYRNKNKNCADKAKDSNDPLLKE
ncbi:MAG: hypothetical protein R6U95_07025 [Bacteroidales bacterium]